MKERLVRAEASVELAERQMLAGRVNRAHEAALEGIQLVEGMPSIQPRRIAIEARLIAVEACLYLDDFELAEVHAKRAMAAVDRIRKIAQEREELAVLPELDEEEIDDAFDPSQQIRCQLAYWKVREFSGDGRALQKFQRIASECLTKAPAAPLGLLASRHVVSCAIEAKDFDAGRVALAEAFEAFRMSPPAYVGQWLRWRASFLILDDQLETAKQCIDRAQEVTQKTESAIDRIENVLVLAHLEFAFGHDATALELLTQALESAMALGLEYLVRCCVTAYL